MADVLSKQIISMRTDCFLWRIHRETLLHSLSLWMKLLGITRNTYYKYKKEMKTEDD